MARDGVQQLGCRAPAAPRAGAGRGGRARAGVPPPSDGTSAPAASSRVRPTSCSSAAASSRSGRRRGWSCAVSRQIVATPTVCSSSPPAYDVVAVGRRGKRAQPRAPATSVRRVDRRRRPGMRISATRKSRKPSSSSASRRIAGASVAGPRRVAASSERTSSWSRSRNFSTRPSTRTASPSAKRASSSSTSVPHAGLDPAARDRRARARGTTRRRGCGAAPCERPRRRRRRPGPRRARRWRSRGQSRPGAAARLERSGRRQAVSRPPLRRGCRPAGALVAPPYDVISAEQRAGYLALESAQRRPPDAARLRGAGGDPAASAGATRGSSSVTTAGALGARAGSSRRPGRRRAERARASSCRCASSRTTRGSSSRTSARTPGPKEGRLRLLRATRTQLEPIFLLHDGPRPEVRTVSRRSRRPRALRHPALARTDPETIADRLAALAPQQLLIADGHHRYETALAFHDEDGTDASAWLMMVVLVATAAGRADDLPDAPARIARSRSSVCMDARSSTFAGRASAPGPSRASTAGDGRSRASRRRRLDVEIVDAAQPEDVTYTAERDEAVAAVDRGDAEGAFLIRPTPLDQVCARARRGEVMPQKTHLLLSEAHVRAALPSP